MLKFTRKCFSKTILITGGNKGLGLEVAKKLLEKELKSTFSTNNLNSNNEKTKETYNIILTSRDTERGLNAIKELKHNFNLENLPSEKIKFHQLDISNESSINGCIEFLKNLKKNEIQNDQGIIDILLNNAGAAYPGILKINIDVYNHIFTTNVFGTMRFTEIIIAENLLKENSKIIFLASSLGRIARLGEKIQSEFNNENLTKENLIEFSQRFKNSIINKTYFEEGWGKHVYALSKIIVKKYAEILAEDKNLRKKQIQVYSCCPGWTKTDLGGHNASRTLEEGVVTVLYLIELEHFIREELQGKFFYDCQIAEM